MAETEVPLSPPPSPVAGTGAILLGKYQLRRFLGRGSFAKVYEAISLSDGSTVAVKIIDKIKTVDAAMEPRIVREIDAMKRLHRHPNILKIHEVMATKSKIYLVVEFAAGGELFTKISRRGRLSESAARRYFLQLVSALDFCHKNGVAHRDLKPQNLLLDKDGGLKVSDFGLSALPEQLQNGLLLTACGTPAYTAPEVVSRRGYDGSKADAWSCGVILFFLLAGHLPFDDSNIATMYKKIYRRDYQFPAWISKPAKHLIIQLLDPNPKSRMSIEALIQNSWFQKSIQWKIQKDCKDDNSFPELVRNSKPENSVPVMNAFDIISMSSGLNLSGLFEPKTKTNEKRFTTKFTADELEEKVRVIGGEMGFRVTRPGKNRSIEMGRGRVFLSVEVSEMAPSLLMVEMKVEEAEIEFEELQWRNFKTKLQDIVDSWHQDNK